jgi:hypothetical protein
MKDGFIINSQEYQFRIIEMIRKYQPEIVLCNAIDDDILIMRKPQN